MLASSVIVLVSLAAATAAPAPAPAATVAPAPTAPVAAPATAPATEASKLFDKARAAMKANNLTEACPAFEQSYVLEPALGTLLNLGACYEKQGKFASAWIRYNDAVNWAQRTHEADREQYARKMSNDVKGKVSWLAISASEDVDVKVDTQTIHVTPTPISVPVDPGLHALVAEKPSYEKWAVNVEIVQPGTTSVQKIPQLKPATLSAAPAATPPVANEPKMEPVPWSAPPLTASTEAPPPMPLATRPTVTKDAGGSTAGAGAALLVTGGLAAIAGGVGLAWSIGTYNRLQNQRINVLPPESYVSREDYERIKWVYPASWAAVGVGAAAIVTGAILVGKKQPVTVTPVATPGGAAVSLSGEF